MPAASPLPHLETTGTGELRHCLCGHNAPPHTETWCHRCECQNFVDCSRCESHIRTTMQNLSRSNWRTRQVADLHTVLSRINLEHAPTRDYLCGDDDDAVRCRCGEFFSTLAHHAGHLADVAIAEAGFRQAMRSASPAEPVESRWVTEWVAE